MSVTETIVKISDLFDGWRTSRSQRLRNGVELIGRSDDGDDTTWLHALFPPLSVQELAQLQREAGVSFPPGLRMFYRALGGMTLFHGAFVICGRRRSGIRTTKEVLQPDSLADLNHAIDALGWKPPAAVAFAVNAWDQSVHLANMGSTDAEIVRCDRATGRVLESHEHVFQCLWERLYRLDRLMLV